MRLAESLRANEVLWECLYRFPALNLPAWYLGAGCVAQTIWNLAHDKVPGADILDYDLVYYDRDLSEARELDVSQAARAVVADLAIELGVENEVPTDALVRELEEEIGVKALAFEEIGTLEEPQPAENGEANYHIFAVTAWTGEPRLLNAEHSELRWLSLDQALVLPLAHPRYGQLFRAVLEGPESAKL